MARRLIVRDNAQDASKYIADYIIGASPRLVVQMPSQLTNAYEKNASRSLTLLPSGPLSWACPLVAARS